MTQPEIDENKTTSADTPMVIFGEDWGGHPSSTQHLARELSKFHEITWVNSIGMRSPKLSVDDFARVMTKGWRMIKPSPKFTPEEANHQNPLNKKSPTDCEEAKHQNLPQIGNQRSLTLWRYRSMAIKVCVG